MLAKKVFQVEGKWFIAYNADFLPEIPTLEQNLQPNHLLSTGAMVRWAAQSCPHLGLVLATPKYSGTIFGRLAQSEFLFPIEECPDGTFILEKDLRRSWSSLERGLNHISQILWNAETPDALWHNTFRSYSGFPLPSSFGYQRSHKSPALARKRANLSRDAFIFLMARCSHAIILHSFIGPTNPAELVVPRWIRILQAAGVSSTWIDVFKDTQVADISGRTRRVGLFIDPYNCPFLDHIGFFIRAKVPVWVRMGSYPMASDAGCGVHLSLNEIDKANATIIEVKPPVESTHSLPPHESTLSAEPDPSSPPAVNQRVARRPVPPPPSATNENAQFPATEAGSGQDYGETWQQFFEKREKKNERKKSTESAERARQRAQRTSQAGNAMPGSKGAKVYRWEPQGEQGFLVREEVTRAEVPHIWEQYSPEQRRYDPFNHEWDLCEAFAPAPEKPRQMFDDDSDDESDFENTIPHSTPTFLAEETDEDVYNLHDPYRHQDIQIVKFESLQNILYLRHGLQILTVDHIAEKAMTWELTVKALGSHDARSIAEEQRPSICHFFTCRQNGRPVPTHLDTLDNDHPYSLRYVLKEDNKIRLFSPKVGLYIIQVVESTYEWMITVEDPVTCLEVIRRKLHSVEDIVELFISQGYPFSTKIRTSAPRQIPDSITPDVCLGWRKKDYQFTWADYHAYESARHDILRSPRGRAAMMKGGVVWRLAMEHFIAMDSFFDGPNEDAFMPENVIKLDNGDELWDNDLSPNELDVICGVYRIYTGVGQHQASHSSWWPRIKSWPRQSINIGYWTPECETFFRNRRTEIHSFLDDPDRSKDRSAERILKSSGAWDHRFRTAKQGPRILKVEQEITSNYISAMST